MDLDYDSDSYIQDSFEALNDCIPSDCTVPDKKKHVPNLFHKHLSTQLLDNGFNRSKLCSHCDRWVSHATFYRHMALPHIENHKELEQIENQKELESFSSEEPDILKGMVTF
jgi:hypothetical protein